MRAVIGFAYITGWRIPSEILPTRILACGIYRTDAGLELLAGYQPDDLLRSPSTS